MNRLAKAVLMFVAGVAILLAMSCKRRPAVLSGVVTGRTGEPVAGASVAIFPLASSPNMEPFTPLTILTTDREGRFRFPAIARGAYSVSVTHRTGTAYEPKIDLRNSRARELTLRLSGDTVPVTGTVSDSEGKALSNAIVTLLQNTDAGVRAMAVRSDANGHYTLSAARGWYAVGATRDGYLRDYAVVDVHKPANVPIRLHSDVGVESTPPRAVRDWGLAAGAPLGGSDGLRPLVERAARATVVGIGESTHGTKEFVELRGGVFMELAQRHGFTVYAVEASYTKTLPLDDYVQTGRGDLNDALLQLGQWPLNTAEFRKLVESMRAFNERSAHKVRIIGLDYDAEEGDANAVIARDDIARHQAALAKWSAEARRSKDWAYVVRERAMADTVLRVLADDPKAKILIAAHNSHIARSGEGSLAPSLGEILAARLGADYQAVGLSFTEGSFTASGPAGIRTFKAAAPRASSLEAALAVFGDRTAVFDFSAVANPEVARWLSTRHPARHIGSLYDARRARSYDRPPIAPAKMYDSFVLIPRGSPTRSLLPGDGAGMFKGLPKASAPRNLQLDEGTVGEIPTGWETTKWSARHFDHRLTDQGCATRRCAQIVRGVSGSDAGSAFGNLYQRFDAAPYRGKTIRFSASVRVGGDKTSRAQMWLRIDGAGQVLFLENNDRNPTRSSSWRPQIGATVAVPAQAEAISVGLMLYGPGPAWMDDVRVDVIH